MTSCAFGRVLVVLAWACVQAVALGQAVAPDLAGRVEGLVRAFAEEKQVVGMSVALIEDAKVRRRFHYGWEDREREVAANDATMYRWASISKPLTAVAAMQLVEQGRLDLAADVRTLVPEFPDKFPGEGKTITVRHLLCHQGGIVHYSNGPVVARPPAHGVEHPYEDVVAALCKFADSPVVCEPGEKYSYTTHGYMLVGAAVQKAGGQAYAAQVRERIAKPLGLATLRPDYQWIDIPHRAVGYRRVGQAVVRSTDTDVSWKLAGGGWISTVGDLGGFGAALLDRKLVTAESREAMWTPAPTRDGKATRYGLGFAVGTWEGRSTVSHSGSQEKTATFLLLLPEERAGVAVMCNTEGTGLNRFAHELAGMLVDKPDPAVASPAR